MGKETREIPVRYKCVGAEEAQFAEGDVVYYFNESANRLSRFVIDMVIASNCYLVVSLNDHGERSGGARKIGPNINAKLRKDSIVTNLLAEKRGEL